MVEQIGINSPILGQHLETDKLSLDIKSKINAASQDNVSEEDFAKRLENALNEQYITYLNTRISSEGKDTLQINDLVFSMPRITTPPSAIRIDTQNLNYSWQTLRSRGSQKAATGKASTRISLSLYFVGREAINKGLVRLLASFDATPFVFIENDFLRKNLVPQGIEGGALDTMACTLLGLDVSTVPGLVNVLVANLTLLWFNYKPFSPDFAYRHKWEAANREKENTENVSSVRPEGDIATEGNGAPVPNTSGDTSELDPASAPTIKVRLPENSEPLVKYITSKEKNYGRITTEITPAIDFSYRMYRTISGAELAGLYDELGKPGVVVSLPEDITYNTFTRHPERIHLWLWPYAAQKFEEMAKAYYKKFGLPLRITSCFRTKKEQEDLIKEDKESGTHRAAKHGSWHMVGMAVDLEINYPSMGPKEYLWLIDNAPKYGWRNLGLHLARKHNKITGEAWYRTSIQAAEGPVRAKTLEDLGFGEAWHFDFVGDKTGGQRVLIQGHSSASRAIAYLQGQIYAMAPGKGKKEIAQKEQLKILNASLSQKDASNRWHADYAASSSSFLAFYRNLHLTITGQDERLVPQQITISKSNLIAQLPVLSHEFATQQYLGSNDMQAAITFKAVGVEKLGQLQNMRQIVQKNARVSRAATRKDQANGEVIGPPSTIEIRNHIFNLMGFDKGFIESISVQNVVGSPDLYDVTLRMSQYIPPKTPDLRQEKYIKSADYAQTAKYFVNRYVDGFSTYNPQQEQDLKPRGIGLGSVVDYLEDTAASQHEDIWEIFEIAKEISQDMAEHAYRAPHYSSTGTLRGSYSSAPPPLPEPTGKFEPNPGRQEKMLNSKYAHVLVGWYNGERKLPSLLFNSSQTAQMQRFYNSGAYSKALRDVFGLYICVLFAIAVYRNIPSYEWLTQNGIPSFDDSWFGPPDKDKAKKEADEFYKALQGMLKHANNLIFAEGLDTDPSFIDFFYLNRKAYTLWAKGLPCYPDLDLPIHPALAGLGESNETQIYTDPDFYFYNEAIEGDMGSRKGKEDFKLRAESMMRNSWKSLGYHCSPQAYSTDIYSPNKFALDYEPFRGDKIGDEDHQRKEIMAHVIHDGDLPYKRSWSISVNTNDDDDTKLRRVWKLDEEGKALAKPFKENTAIDIQYKGTADPEPKKKQLNVEFGAKVDDKNAVRKPRPKREAALDEILDGSWSDFQTNTFRMARAFPTFKIYFIEDDASEQKHNVKNFDDFYSYSAIKDIRLVRSRKIPADLCVITLTNVHGELDNLAYGASAGEGEGTEHSSNRIVEKFDPLTVNTDQENPFDRLVVMEGSKIQIKLGYSNDPSKLETLLNGQVVEVAVSETSPDIIQIVCQSYATELVSELKGTEKKKEEYDSTQELLSAMICSPEVTHFGRWHRSARYNPSEIRTPRSDHHDIGWLDEFIASIKDRILKKWEFYNKPQDDNIFAPDYDSYADIGGVVASWLDTIGMSGLAGAIVNSLIDNRKYHPFYVTIWDIFKEMELRHPGFIASPVPYGQRYTMFFGTPTAKYWYRPMELDEQYKLDQIRNEVKRFWSPSNMKSQAFKSWAKKHHALVQAAQEQDIRQAAKGNEAYISAKEAIALSPKNDNISKEAARILKKEYLATKIAEAGLSERFKPFRRYWTLTSDNHIIANNIRASSHGTHNAVELEYFDDAVGYKLQRSGLSNKGALASAIEKEHLTMKMKADDNIEDKDTRVMHAQYWSCYGNFFARRYGIGLMMRSLRDTYKGELLVLGNPNIKPYDVCWVYDTYNDIFGPIEVEQVTHILSLETGFVTEIKPDLVINANDYATASALDALGRLATDYAKEISAYLTGSALAAATIGVSTVAGGSIGLVAMLWGGYKFIQWTQGRQPLIFTPLIKRHKPLLAGLDGYKFDSFLANINGKWTRFTKDVKAGWKDFWESEAITGWAQKHISDIVNR